MLAAYVPHGTQAWFFKLAGPAAAVAKLAAAFRKFVATVRFEGDVPHYEAPADWQPQGGNPFRHETFRIPNAGQPLELVVSKSAGAGDDEQGYLLANVNRWRSQMGLAPLDAAKFGRGTERWIWPTASRPPWST